MAEEGRNSPYHTDLSLAKSLSGCPAQIRLRILQSIDHVLARDGRGNLCRDVSTARVVSPGLARPVVVAAFCGLMAGAFFDERANFQYAPWRKERRVNPFFELTSLKRISGDAPICIVTQSWFNQMWAVFFFRATNS